MTAKPSATNYRFGRCELQPAERRLLVDGAPVALGARAFDLLVALVERAGDLVTKAELLDRVWPGLVVEENNLQVHVSALRKLVGTAAIATVAGSGYRFTLQVERADRPAAATPPQAAADKPSIAVLPFVNMSDDAANEYFADGLAEELLNVLAKIRGLRVTSRTSAFSFRGAHVDIAAVARALNVATILEGSVRKSGQRVRITAQLVHAASDSTLWSQTYERDLTDIFAVQDDIAHSVVKELHAALLGEQDAAEAARVSREIAVAVNSRSENMDAYQLYLQGKFFGRRFNADDRAKAIDYLERALQCDPGYASAWAELSDAYLLQADGGLHGSLDKGIALARDAAARALALAPDLGRGHAVMGNIHMHYDWDWMAAEIRYRRALELAPEDADSLADAARLAQRRGRLDESAVLLARLMALDPLNVGAYHTLSVQFAVTGRPQEAEAALRKALELNPSSTNVHAALSNLYLIEGRPSDALREAQAEPHAGLKLTALAKALHALGRFADSDVALDQLIRDYADYAAYQVATVYGQRGDADRAFDWLKRAYRQRDTGLSSLKLNIILVRALQDDPRWEPFVEKVGLADVRTVQF
ncbi:MAG: winged helix-turn-helix domain-containing protein [Casimicrobiaceae bacterium]